MSSNCRLTTNNPIMESLLDSTLKDDNRRLLLVGHKDDGGVFMISSDEKHISFLEDQLTTAKRQVVAIKLALALSNVANTLKVEITETHD